MNMKKYTKIIALALALCLMACALCGCGKTEAAKNVPAADIAASVADKIGKTEAMTAVDANIIDRAAAIAVDFISRVMAEKTLRIEDDTLKVKSVYDRSDSTRSGVNLTLTITEKQGVCADAYYPQDQDQIGTTVSDG